MTARTLPTMPAWSTGQEITSSLLNQITAYSQFWADRPMFRMYQSVTQSIPTSANTQVTMDVSQWDTDSGRQGVTPYNYVVPFAGRWRFTALVVYAGNATGARQTILFQNGSAAQGFGPAANGGATVTIGGLTVCTLSCNVGDVIGVWSWQNSGGALSTNVASNQTSYFEGELLSLANP